MSKRSLMIKAALLLSLLASAYAQTTYSRYQQPVNPGSGYFVSCANGGAGEVVAFTGTIQYTLRQETYANGQILREFDQSDLGAKRAIFTITGIGQTTGMKYQIRYSEVFTGTVNDSLPPANRIAAGMDDQNWTIIGNTNGHAITWFFHDDYKYTSTIANPFVVTDEHFSVLCQ